MALGMKTCPQRQYTIQSLRCVFRKVSRSLPVYFVTIETCSKESDGPRAYVRSLSRSSLTLSPVSTTLYQNSSRNYSKSSADADEDGRVLLGDAGDVRVRDFDLLLEAKQVRVEADEAVRHVEPTVQPARGKNSAAGSLSARRADVCKAFSAASSLGIRATFFARHVRRGASAQDLALDGAGKVAADRADVPKDGAHDLVAPGVRAYPISTSDQDDDDRETHRSVESGRPPALRWVGDCGKTTISTHRKKMVPRGGGNDRLGGHGPSSSEPSERPQSPIVPPIRSLPLRSSAAVAQDPPDSTRSAWATPRAQSHSLVQSERDDTKARFHGGGGSSLSCNGRAY